MNYRIITYVIGWVLNLEAICMTLPAVTGLIYGEKTWTSFLITGLISALAGTLLVVRRPEKPHFFMKEGCVSVALSRRSQVLQQREPALWHLWKMHHVVS